MKERPILMHARSIRGIMEGRKTQTRRILKLGKDYLNIGIHPFAKVSAVDSGEFLLERWSRQEREFGNFGRCDRICCPYGKPSDRLWVKEVHYLFGYWALSLDGKWSFNANRECGVRFEGPGADELLRKRSDLHGWYTRSSLFMPRWASRLTLEITDIRVERVQCISEEDCVAEGCPPIRAEFMRLWEDTNGKGAWDRNDWVWVISFRPGKQEAA